MINAKVLDSRQDDNGTCYLCQISLDEYVSNIPETYQDYEIQRGIVKNIYLDTLVETIVQKRHIPPIVLILQNYKKSTNKLNIKDFKILDGLQRTFRLLAIKKTVDIAARITNVKASLALSKFKFSRKFSNDLTSIDSSSEILRRLLLFKQENSQKELLKLFSDNYQWFEAWSGLSPQDEIQKMLTLNAGHKPVSNRHQLELLFLNVLERIEENTSLKFKLVREKELSSTQFSKNRKQGYYHFAHIITSLISLFGGKPVIPSSELIKKLQDSSSISEEYPELSDYEFISEYIRSISKLDEIITSQYGKIGTLWMGREVTLTSIFAAIGTVSKENEVEFTKTIRHLISLIERNNAILNLTNYEEARNNLELSKVNIGNVNRKAIYACILDLLRNNNNKTVKWNEYFSRKDA